MLKMNIYVLRVVFMKKKNEFRRETPKTQHRKLIYDLTTLLVPITIIVIGIFLSTQKFSELVGYNPAYCDRPIYVLKHSYGRYPEGYPIFNPLVILITMFTNPFDQVAQDAIAIAAVPGVVCTVLGIVVWLVISVIRSAGINKKQNLYGTARWGNEKDLKLNGLCEEHGVVLCQQWSADTEMTINSKGNKGLKVKKTAPLICHSGNSHTLMIAPTRSGKGVGSVTTTCVSFRQSMIIFDPKGELYNMTAGYRQQFSRVIKYSPVREETACFNPLEEVELDANAFKDIGTILTNIFNSNDKKGDSNSDFFDNNARDLLTGVIFHVLSAMGEDGGHLYPREERNIAGVLRIFARAANGEDEEGNPLPAGEALLDEMINSKHLDKYGNESDYIHGIILDVAMSAKQQHEKVRSDIMQTVQSKLNLFRDPLIANSTSHSDFKLSDFYESDVPITLYLTVPFGQIDRVAPVFKLLIDFILRRFSSGELRAGVKEETLQIPILFMLDEFPTLGKMDFLAKSMGVLAGLGMRFYIIVQMYTQILELYGQHNTFMANCRYKIIYAPQEQSDCEMFSKMMGKESVRNDNMSVSGSRYAVALNNLNVSSQEVARDLINPDELMKLPYTDCIVMAEGMPPYMGKKLAYYDDDRFKDKVYFENQDTGEVKTGFLAPYSQEEINREVAGLPSNIKRREADRIEAEQRKVQGEKTKQKVENEAFDPVKFLESYLGDNEGKSEKWDSPWTGEIDADDEPPPKLARYSPEDFDLPDDASQMPIGQED